MSRCKACDTIMSEYELKRTDRSTGLHLDLCNECAKYSTDAMQDAWNDTDAEIKLLHDTLLDRSAPQQYNILKKTKEQFNNNL